MRSLRLRDLRRKSASYFKRIDTVSVNRRDRYAYNRTKYIVERIYESLPQIDKKYISNPERVIENTTNILLSGYDDNINVRKALKEISKHTRLKRHIGTLQEMYKLFRYDESSLYSKYNSYMYRNGYSASKYWFENAETTTEGSVITAFCELPTTVGENRVKYSVLQMIWDKSSGEFEAHLV